MTSDEIVANIGANRDLPNNPDRSGSAVGAKNIRLPSWWVSSFGAKPYAIMDCMEGFKKIPDKSIDLVATDPPYYMTCSEDWDKQWKDYEDFLVWLKRLLDECHRVLKDNGTLYIFTAFGNAFNRLTDTIYSTDFIVRNMILWWRETPGLMQSIKRFTINYDIIWFMVKTEEYTWNLDDVRVQHWRKFDKRANPLGKSPGCIWYEFNPKMGRHVENVGHPTVKPSLLMERMVLASSNPGDIVLDPFLGSGSTLLASRKNGRVGIGFEMNSKYEEVIKTRSMSDIKSLEEYF